VVEPPDLTRSLHPALRAGCYSPSLHPRGPQDSHEILLHLGLSGAPFEELHLCRHSPSTLRAESTHELSMTSQSTSDNLLVISHLYATVTKSGTEQSSRFTPLHFSAELHLDSRQSISRQVSALVIGTCTMSLAPIEVHAARR
jgi:hypothetical protein